MSRWIRLVCVAAVAAIVVGCANVSVPIHRAKGQQIQSVPHVADAAVRVETRNGAVQVVRQPDAAVVTVTADITCAGVTRQEADQRLTDTTLSVTRADSGELVVKPVFAGGARNGDGASIAVFLADANGVTIDTSNGAVTVQGLKGTLVVDTSNGSINIIDHVGDAVVDTSNAPVVVKNHQGGAAIDTSNGAVSVESMVGRLVVDTSNGPVLVRDLDGPADIESSNGAIDFVAAGSSGPLRLVSSNAPVNATLGAAFSGELAMKTSNGRVNVNDQASRITSKSIERTSGNVVIGDGGEKSIVQTSNGSITIVVSAES